MRLSIRRFISFLFFFNIVEVLPLLGRRPLHHHHFYWRLWPLIMLYHWIITTRLKLKRLFLLHLRNLFILRLHRSLEIIINLFFSKLIQHIIWQLLLNDLSRAVKLFMALDFQIDSSLFLGVLVPVDQGLKLRGSLGTHLTSKQNIDIGELKT